MRKWLIALPLILILIFLPQIASTPLGKPFFIKALEAKSHSQVQVDTFSLSWFGPQKFKNVKFQHGEVSGSIEEFEIEAPFWSFSGAFQLKNGSILYQGGHIDQIEGQIVDHDFELHGATLNGRIALKGTIYSKLHFNIEVDIVRFPLLVIDKRLDQILGPTINLQGTVSQSEKGGLIDLDIRSDNLTSNLKGNLNPDSITLREKLTASIRLTPALSDLLLKDANPLFFTSISSENPIFLEIDTNDFSFPLPFTLEKLKMRGKLDLKKVVVENGKSLATLIALLKDDRLTRVKKMEAWFTPLSFSIDQLIVKTGRLDALLANSIHICSWGQIDLSNERLHMYIGLPADTLKRSFGIENLSENYVLKIEVRGTAKDPEIIKGPAVAKIAALIAGSQIPKNSVFGKVGELFSKPKEEKGVPPAKRPFPWEH